ncbi:hypothetical protein L0152_30555 [bacterium]|nr:hypothetical protein [bacterium]
MRREYTYEVWEQPDPPFYQLVSSTPASETATSLAYRFGAGTTIVLLTELELDVGVHYQNIDYGFVYLYPGEFYKASLNLFGVSVGVMYRLK